MCCIRQKLSFILTPNKRDKSNLPKVEQRVEKSYKGDGVDYTSAESGVFYSGGRVATALKGFALCVFVSGN